ncbi:MAG: VaFE repeat-containing surface-anchored protein [Coriobacteriales bacterium]|nr:VaFE repeat-containing surface-anchored protein [Coriobacteriales bacterium]
MDVQPRRQRPRRTPTRRGDTRYKLPRAVLRDAGTQLEEQPLNPRHASRSDLSLTAGTGAVHATHSSARRFMHLFLATLLLLAIPLATPFACSITPALAASGNDPKTVTLSTEFRHQLDGQEAYCTNIDVTPPTVGTVLSSWTSGPLLLDYVLYHADGGFDVQYGWEPTRYAVWTIMHNDERYLTTYGSGEAMPTWFSNQVKEIYQAAQDWVKAGAEGPERGCSRIYAPPSNEYQPVAICVPQLGDIKLEKASSLEGISTADACYSLEGAEYTVYADENCSDPVTILTTDNKGQAEASGLSQGSYWVRETKAPRGFAKNEQVYQVSVAPMETASVGGGTVFDQPLYATVDALVRKVDAEMMAQGSASQAQGDATLAGAQFTVRRYANTAGNTGESVVRSWTIQTDGSGKAYLDDAHLVGGDDLYRDKSGAPVLPLGTYTIAEVSAPAGYLAISDGRTFVVEQQGSKAVVKTIGSSTGGTQDTDGLFHFPNSIIRGGVRLGKVDAQNGEHVAQGNATLAGAVLAIELSSDQPVVVDNHLYMPGEVVTTVTVSTDGTAQTADDALPYGSYVAYEVEAPAGYLLANRLTWNVAFQIREDRAVVDLSGVSGSVPDKVKRGDLSFVKVDGQTMRRLGNVPFVIESLTTGERHVLVTDDNGQCSTASNFNAHTQNTNANDVLLDNDAFSLLAASAEERTVEEPVEDEVSGEDEVVISPEETEEAEDEVFATAEEDVLLEDAVTEADMLEDEVTPEVADVPEALDIEAPSDEEAVEELPNEVENADEAEVNQPPEALTEATELEEAELDELTREEPEPESLELTAASFDGPQLDATAGIWFSGSTGLTVEPDDEQGALPYDTYRISEVRCPANEGYDLATFEVRVSRDSFVIDGGTVDDHALPDLQTQLAVVSSDGGSLCQLVDYVYYNNLATDGTTYEVRGSLHLVNEDGTDGGVVTDANGGEAVSSMAFTPTAPSGVVEVPFSLNMQALHGQAVVAFEELWLDGSLIASHTDPQDEDQTVSIPTIATTLTDTEGSKEVYGSGNVQLVDTVRYEGLVPGKTYTLTGTLMDKVTGEALISATGVPIAAEATVVPDAPTGSAEVVFSFDGRICLGRQVVAFEKLSYEGVELAVHADLNDEDQTVRIPRISTTATDASDGDHLLFAGEKAQVIDTVTYEGLIPGEEYVLCGRLVERLTSLGLTNSNEPITSELTFTPEEPNGSVQMTFTFDARTCAGYELTAFETLWRADRLVAAHEDPSSDEQSLSVPAIHTTATSANGTKSIVAEAGQKIVDTITYEGLTVGEDYLVSGVLHVRDKHGKDLGMLLDADGKPVSASMPLIPETSSGTIQATFEVDASELGGRDLVVFELLMMADDEQIIASHEDISDGDQSVSVVKKPTQPGEPTAPTKRVTGVLMPQTGDLSLPIAAASVLATIALIVGLALRKYEQRKGRSESWLDSWVD